MAFRYLSIREFARLYSLSEITVRRHIKAGKIQAVQLGGAGTSWRIPVDDHTPVASPTADQTVTKPPTTPTPPASASSAKPRQTRRPHWLKDPTH